VAYRAEIEIGVKGTEKLRELRNTVNLLANKIDTLDSLADVFNSPIQSLKNYNQTLGSTAKALEQVEIGQEDEAKAIKKYVQALGEANTARARQNNLIQQEIALQEAAKRKTQPGPTGFSRAEFGPALPPAFIKQQDDQQNFKRLFADLNETARVISVSNTNTRTSWKTTFDQLNETAKAISVSRLNTQTSWQETFKQLNETAKAISVSRLNTQTSWQETFKQLNETAKAISVSRLNTQTSWQQTFKELNETAKAISVSRLNTKKVWQDFFKEATEVAEDLRRGAARVSLRSQERRISVQEAISRGRSARIARERSAFLQGSSGPVQLGPSGRAPGTSGFPVAVPLSRAEQKAVDLQNKKLQILNRIKQTRKDLTGLAENLQRLDNNAVVAIKDAERGQQRLNEAKKKSLEISKQIAKSSPIDGAENIPNSPAFLRARSKRRREAASNALIGGAFPLLFGQGAGASLGGALGGGAGGLMGGQFGFGLSLVGTSVGQAFDTLAAKAADLGKALDPVNGNVDTIIQSLGLANTATGKYIKALEQVAGKQVALEEATKQLALVVGDEGVQALREFGEATEDLGNAVSKFITQIAADAAKLLQPATRATGNVISAISEQRAALSSSDPRLAGLQRESRQGTGERTKAEITAELLETYREITRETEKEVEAKLAALDPSNAALKTAERRLAIEQLNGDILNDQVFNLEKQQLAADLIAERTELRRKAEGNAVLQATLQNRLKKLQVEYETALVTLVNKRGDAEEEAAEKAKRAMERRMREFKRQQEEQQRADEQRKKQIDAAVIADLNSVNKLMSVDLQRVKVQDGEMAALKMRQKQIKVELKNKLEILKVQYLQQVQNLKSVEEAKRLYEAYLNQDGALRSQAEIEKILVLNAKKRLTLAREQQILDESRARRGQLEGIQQESSRFSMQLDDPFNANPERLRAFEAEQRTNQILRVEREKLADLERQGAVISTTASAEEVQQLANKIDAQKAFIPALEAELALRNELEAAAFRQSEIIQKYGFIADELATAMTSAVQAVVTGTGTVEEAFSTMFANIGKAFIDMATQMLAQKLFMTVLGVLGGGGSGFNFAGGSASSGLSAANLMGGTGPLNAGLFGRANGGPVTANQPYIVGERGPELFIPFQRGQVVSNEDSEDIMEAAFQRSGGSSNVSNNYGGGSSNVSNSFQQMQMVNLPFTRTAEQASVIAAEREAAQALRDPGPIDVRYESTVINNTEYVTAEQHRRGMAQAAERGRALTLEAMQNSVKFRRKGGI
jgi:hypothetical protein